MVVHYVNANWTLENTIIILWVIDVSHYDENIVELIISVVEEFSLTNNV